MITRKKNLILIFAVLVILWPTIISQAQTAHTTDDGLSMTVTDGRVTNLSIGGQPIQFGGETGGFYVRDYTLGDDGLPANLDSYGNLLGCSTFEGADAGEPECTECLEGEGIWEIFAHPQVSPMNVICQSPTSSNTVAELVLPKTPTTTSTYYIGIYQDINISNYYGAMPNTHDLFCFSFDLATACGFRLKDHPMDWTTDPTTYGPHQIIGRIDWFETESDLTVTDFKPRYSAGQDHRFANTEARIWDTINDATISTSYVPPTDMTSCGLRSYRPQEANYVRVGVIIFGHLPNDGVTVNDHAYFDNFAFYKAPAIVPVETSELLDDPVFMNLKTLDNQFLETNLQMRAIVDVENKLGRDYLWFRGEIRNLDSNPLTTLPPRALDLGFSFPVSGADHDLVWWDDMRHSEDIFSSPSELPFRMAGPVDSRPELKNSYTNSGYSDEVANLRAENIQVSAYPYSALDIETPGGIRGLSFGDNLDAPSTAVSHFGYRVTDPVTESGEYYIEFRLGALEEGPNNVTPFSFILFRCDDPNGVTTSNFRIATDDFQTALFPEFFTRPEPPENHSTEDEWKYGGAFYQAKLVENLVPPPGWILEPNTFNQNTEQYGLRYTQELYTGTDSEAIEKYRDGVIACNSVGVGTLIYRHPWHTQFTNLDGTSMNHFETLVSSRNISSVPWGPPWQDIWAAQQEYQLKLPGDLDLFSREISDSNLEHYHFPVLLADASFGTDLVDLECQYIEEADKNVGRQHTARGLEGIQFDNTFYGKYGANHLHFDSEHIEKFVGEKDGTLTYSINHLLPAIPQLAANVWYLDAINQKLNYIDSLEPHRGDGTDGELHDANLDHELLSVNINEPLYGGSKYGMMHADIGGFESSIDNIYNRRDRSQNFRRTMARDKNMSRLINEVDTATCLVDNWPSCNRWSTLWVDEDDFRTQVMYEAAWISLAWGFMPSITAMFPDKYAFYDQYIKPIFGDDTIPPYGLALTSIFKELHYAGWRPRTQVAVEYIYNKDNVDLYVERFGDSALGDSAVYFTVLNNDDLSLTVQTLAKSSATIPFAEKSIDEIMTQEEFEEYAICLNDLDCKDFPTSCPKLLFDDLHKEFFLTIHNAENLGLSFGHGNLICTQLVYRPENSAVCNWPAVRDWKFTLGFPSQHYSMLRNLTTDTIQIGGPWTSMFNREPLTIHDNVLYVFRLEWGNKVDNGDGGGGEERSGSGSTGEAGWQGGRYERYGTDWRTYDTAGYNGSVDSVAVEDTEACAYYAIDTGTGGELEVLAHFPISSQATAAAQYDVYITDYREGPSGEIALGEPVFTRVIDQSDADTYSMAADEEGFITIGTLDVDLEPMALKTIVVKLSPARDEVSISPSALLVSDAVMVREIERAR